MRTTHVPEIIQRALTRSIEVDVPFMAAALSFHGLFALAPIFLILVALAEHISYGALIQQTVSFYLERYLGVESPQFVTQTASAMFEHAQSNVAFVIGVIVLIYIATNFFTVFQESLEKIFGHSLPANGSLATYLFRRVISVACIAVVAALVALLAGLNMFLDQVTTFVGQYDASLVHIYTQAQGVLVTFAVVALLFSVIYRYFSFKTVSWQSAAYGGMCGSVLFLIATFVVAMYFHYSEVSFVYGVAASAIITLLWAYYMAHVFFFGAAITHAHAELKGGTFPLGK